MAMQFLDQENPPYTSAVLELTVGRSISVLRIRDLADVYEMGLEGSLVVVTAVVAPVSASLLSGIPLCPSTHRRAIGTDRALRSDLRWWATGVRHSIYLSSD